MEKSGVGPDFCPQGRLGIALVPDLLWNVFAFADLCREPLSALFNATTASTAGCTRAAVRSYVTQAVTRCRNSSAVLFWEVGNEWNALADGHAMTSTS